MTIDDADLIQVYATVLVGVLIFMTVQRLFEWKKYFDKMDSELKQLIGRMLADRDAHQDALDRLEVNRREGLESDRELYEQPHVLKGYEDEKKRLKGLIEMREDGVHSISKQINNLTDLYVEKGERLEHIHTIEKFLNVFMVALMVISIILILVILPPYGRIISIIIFSAGISLLIVRVILHGVE